ncbi:organic solute carrier partner 1 [Trypanosoma grayi]|uniref:organic solute carrier partner 1 n=1 Tax=Trypanosoma grayi TaxID=71804 RepID=UPI0004F40878|nr:organic solute carrier partner 1 [Trypanosoma grayi]KEG14797.1 organic solute carrier partner 1 [Trypanosoma grayi]
MAAGSLPFLILNYGMEMLFILNTRLIAQKVNKDAARVVMNDIVRHMCNPEFIDELFRPQPLYSYAATKETFRSLSKTSVMGLSTVSMNKLFDLMTMGVKYQVFTLRHPMELVEFTWTHLEEVQRLLPPETQVHLRPLFARLDALCSSLTPGHLAEIRKEILNFFIGRNTLVSVLLEEGLQAPTRSFYLPDDKYLPPLAAYEAPGSIRFYNKSGEVSNTVTFEHRDAALRHPPTIPVGMWNPKDRASRMTKSGLNLYALHRRSGRVSDVSPHAIPSESASLLQQNQQAAVRPETLKAVTGELNYLSQLVACGSKAPQQTFKLSLFDDASEDLDDDAQCVGDRDEDGVPPSVGSRPAPALPVSRMSKTDVQAQNKELLRIVDGLRADKTATKPLGAGQDLLDIMDED